MDAFVNMICSVGFPIAVAAYLLVVMRKSLDKLTQSIEKLIIVIDKKIGN